MLYIQESYVNATEGYRFGDSSIYETEFETTGDLFRACQREHGRCTSKVYIGDIDSQPIGWVFEKLGHYEDTNEPYLLETWITVHDKPESRTVKYHYHNIGPGKGSL